MDNTVLLLLCVLVALVGLGIALLLFNRGRGRDQERGQDMAELSGRLMQMAESQAAVQERLASALQAQERAVSKTLEERLADFSKRVGDRLQETATQNQTTMTDLRERLAVIDRAQKNITECIAPGSLHTSLSHAAGLSDIAASHA